MGYDHIDSLLAPLRLSRNYIDIYGRSRDVNVVLYLRADFQHKFRFNLILPLVCYVGGSLKNGLVLTYIQAL
jgi:hypothetical protein